MTQCARHDVVRVSANEPRRMASPIASAAILARRRNSCGPAASVARRRSDSGGACAGTCAAPPVEGEPATLRVWKSSISLAELQRKHAGQRTGALKAHAYNI